MERQSGGLGAELPATRSNKGCGGYAPTVRRILQLFFQIMHFLTNFNSNFCPKP